jgi:hypothetical protein
MAAEFPAGANLKPGAADFASASLTHLKRQNGPAAIKLPGR